tara:strand:- start:1086 stop:3173 length:2088 start_codon:yes stop_codon:yes gene_type:complete
MTIKLIKTYVTLLFCLLVSLVLKAQTVDVNGDGTLNILIIGSSNSIENNFEEFSPNQITNELESILLADTSILISVNVVAEDIYKMKAVSTGIAGMFTANRNYYRHSLTQYYFWPDGRTARMDNLEGTNGVDWDYIVIGADPYIISKMPGYYSLGLNKIAAKINKGGAKPLLLMEWLVDTTFTNHFEEFTYRAADGSKTPIQVIPSGLAWNALPSSLKDIATVHPTPNGAYLAAASIYSHLYNKSASSSQYTYNDTIADIAETTVINSTNQTHYVGNSTFISPFKNCGVSDINLIYNHLGTSTENGILSGLQWVVAKNQKTLQFGASAPVHCNFGRSSMGGTHLYNIDPVNFDYSFGFPLQDDASTGLVTMLYGLDKRRNTGDVETDLGTARQMINQSELPYARNVPLRTLIAQMLEEIPGVKIYPPGDPWHLSSDVNIAIGSYMYTILTNDCSCDTMPSDSTQWRTWMAHKIGQRTAWNVMSLNEIIPCSDFSVDVISSCGPYLWIDDITHTSSDSTSIYILRSSTGCDSVITLNLTIDTLNLSVTQTGTNLSVNQSGAFYQWLNCSTMTAITGATNQSYTTIANGNYAAIVSNNGCLDTTDCYNVNTVGVIENDFGSELLLYPNPTNGNFSIDLGNNYQNIKITITDLSGKTVLSNSFNESQLLQLKIEEPAGVYLLMIESANKKAVIKLIKE